MPVPFTAIWCGLPAAVSVNVKLATRLPVPVGVKLKLTWQPEPAASVGPQALEVIENSPRFAPAKATLEMFMLDAPVLVIVVRPVPLVVPTR